MIQSTKALFCIALSVSGVLAIPTPLQQADTRHFVRDVNSTKTTIAAPSPSLTVVDGGKLSAAALFALAANNPQPNSTVNKRDGARHIKRMTQTVAPQTSVTPIVIDGGTLSAGALAGIQPLTPNASTVMKEKRNASPVKLAERADTTSPFVTSGWANYSMAVANFSMDGPFQSIQAHMGSSNMIGLTLTDLAGTTKTFMGNINEVPSSEKTITFKGNERITEMHIQDGSGDAHYPTGFSFTTDGGQQYNATPAVGLVPNADEPNGGTVTIGSGIIGRIRAANSSVGLLCAFEVDMIDTLSDISISKIDYSGFTNNIMPTGEGNTVILGSQILDNTNSSIEQSMSLQTTSAVQKSRTITVDEAYTFGASLSIAAKVEVPFVAETTTTVGTNWQLQETSSESDATQTTITNAATYNLACPASKFCQASSFFLIYNVDVNFNCTFTATTVNGGQYSWGQSGTYKGADSTTAQLTLKEYAKDPST